MIEGKKVGVLIHGYNVHSKNWQEVVWWRCPELIGRLPTGTKIIHWFKPEIIIFGTGSSEKNGKIEAAWMRDYLLEYFLELVVLPDFSGVNLEKLRKRIVEISQLETRSKNTYEDIQYTAQTFKAAGVEIICMVSSPDHVSRCSRDAAEIYSQDKELKIFQGNFFTWSSQVPCGKKGEWPIVIESAHPSYSKFQKALTL